MTVGHDRFGRPIVLSDGDREMDRDAEVSSRAVLLHMKQLAFMM